MVYSAYFIVSSSAMKTLARKQYFSVLGTGLLNAL